LVLLLLLASLLTLCLALPMDPLASVQLKLTWKPSSMKPLKKTMMAADLFAAAAADMSADVDVVADVEAGFLLHRQV
jgi:hypothetical protein